MMALVYNKCVFGDRLGVYFICIEQIDKFRFCGRCLFGRHEPDVVGGWAGSNLKSIDSSVHTFSEVKKTHPL